MKLLDKKVGGYCRVNNEAGVLAELPLGQGGHTRQAALTGDGMTGERTQ